jgi:tetratricopeptide (TPR) repeat protein
MGGLYSEIKQDSTAEVYFNKSYQLDSNEKNINQLVARYRYIKQEQNWDRALVLLQREVKHHPDYADSYLDIAHVYFAKNEFDSTEKYLLHYLKLNPKDEDVNYNLLLLYRDRKNYAKALIQVDSMRQRGIAVNDTLYRQILANGNIQQQTR